MATKNLSRTPIEGGRTGRNKHDRRYSNREERVATRGALAKVRATGDGDDLPIIKRNKVMKEFADKLSVVYRFLDANVGKYWPKVYSELRKKFDSRTTAGRHILFDHMLCGIKGAGQQEQMYEHSFAEYYINEASLLMKSKKARRGGKQVGKLEPKPKQLKPISLNKIAKWLGGMGVVKQGEVLYWGVPAGRDHWVVEVGKQSPWASELRYRMLDHTGKPYSMPKWAPAPGEVPVLVPCYATTLVMRQGKRMAEEDVKFFNSLQKNIKDWLLQM